MFSTRVHFDFHPNPPETTSSASQSASAFIALKSMGLRVIGVLLMALGSTVAAQEVAPDRDEEIEQLKAIIAALESRVEALENQAGRQDAATASAARLSATGVDRGNAPPAPDTQALDFSPSGAERTEEADATATVVSKEAPIAFKGALRYNVFFNDGNDASESKRGESGLDLFRIGAAGSYDNVKISAEYRFYSYMNTIHHGWIGYDFPKSGQLELGVSQVPFGILPYASHNFWFGVPYYLGLADDYDLGLKWTDGNENWDWHLGFYKNGELGSPSDLERYSFDLVTDGALQANEETNQLNARVARTLGRGTDSVHEIGLSARVGQIYNSITGDLGSRWAAAIHLDSRLRRWNFQLQLAHYDHAPENPAGVSDETVRLGAFAGAYDMSSSGTVGVANIAYNVPVSVPGIDQILVYNDFSILSKDMDNAGDSILNTTGAAIGAGPLFIYLDLIHARNMVYFGEGSLAGGDDRDWNSRLNLNIGYYW